jgi:pilus assembly protein CpaB
MSRRVVVVAVALVLGVVGTTAVAAYVKSADARASSAQQTVPVFAAKGLIPAGTTGAAAEQQGLFEQQQLPTKLVPAGAVTDLNSVAGLVAINDIPAQQVLLVQLFTTDRRGGALTIPDGRMAVTVELKDLTQRVAGFVTPGSEVAVFDNYGATGAPTGSSAGGTSAGSTSGLTTRVLIPRVEVIAVGPNALTKSQTDPAVATTLMTLALNQKQSEQVIRAAQTDELYFALLTPHSKLTPSAGINANNLFK